MQTKASGTTKKAPIYNKNNTIETLSDFGSSTVKNTAKSFKNIGSGIFDQMFGWGGEQPQGEQTHGHEQKAKTAHKKEFSLFNYNEYYERELVKNQIKELTAQIKQEIELIKRADAQLLNEVKDVEKLVLMESHERPGVYDIRFMEIVISILRTLRAKISESSTWMQALMSKKKKRGSAFVANSKKKGTQYSLSQELSTARSVQ